MFIVHGSVVKHGVPAVFVEGTGGCCDLFAKCYHLYNGYQSKMEISKEQNENVKAKLRQTLKIVNHELAETSCTNAPDETVDFFDLIYECVSTRNICLNFLNFNIHSLTGNHVNSALLQALLKGNTHTHTSIRSLLNISLVTSEDTSSCQLNLKTKHEQLNLAYDWRQIDVVTKCIIIYERDWQVEFSID